MTSDDPEVDELAESRKSQILKSTIGLLAERGEANVRLRDVARAAGLSIGTLQHYFETRDNLILEAFLLHNTGVIQSILIANDPLISPWDRLHRMVGVISEQRGLAFRSRVWIELVANAPRNPRVRSAVQQTYETWREVFHQAISEGTRTGAFKPLLPEEEVTSILLAAIDGFEIVFALEIGAPAADVIQLRLRGLVAALLGVEMKSELPVLSSVAAQE